MTRDTWFYMPEEVQGLSLLLPKTIPKPLVSTKINCGLHQHPSTCNTYKCTFGKWALSTDIFRLFHRGPLYLVLQATALQSLLPSDIRNTQSYKTHGHFWIEISCFKNNQPNPTQLLLDLYINFIFHT